MPIDLDDAELEFERMSQGIDVQAALAYAQHRATVIGLPMSRMIHLSAVGELAGKYADVHFIGFDTLHRSYLRQACTAAGYLHETLLQGSSFEDIVEVVDEGVARLVSAVTPDIRLPFPERVEFLANRVGLAEASAQLVKLADLAHECQVRIEAVEADQAAAKDWLSEAATTLSSLHKINDSKLKSRVVALKESVRSLELRLKTIKLREKENASAIRAHA